MEEATAAGRSSGPRCPSPSRISTRPSGSRATTSAVGQASLADPQATTTGQATPGSRA
jgi:hypothetical protein